MAFQLVYLGAVANDGTGDPLRDGGDIINNNFLIAATTGSNIFRGDQIISGALEVTGSGDNVFYGNNVFTGSAQITGSLGITGSLDITDYIAFDTASTPSAQAVGRFTWNEGEGTLDLGLKGGNSVLQLGQELIARAFNAETSSITDGQVVYITGSQGNRIAVKLASSIFPIRSGQTIGVVTEPIGAGEEGFVTIYGKVNHLNTIGLAEGEELWLGTTPGSYTNIRPIAPTHSVSIGYVGRIHATVGTIFVKIQDGQELESLHDVSITSASYGDLLMKDGIIWLNTKQLSGSYGITGSLDVSGSIIGTASYAITASYALNGGTGNIDTGNYTVVEDSNYSILDSDGIVATTGSLTTNRTWTLPTESNAGKKIIISDEAQVISSNYIILGVGTGKKLNQVVDGQFEIKVTGKILEVISDGSGSWNYDPGYVPNPSSGADPTNKNYVDSISTFAFFGAPDF